MSNKLSETTSGKSLDNITVALPISIAKNIKKSIVEQVFVWVTKDRNTANSLVKILLADGFTNVKLDSKGTTVTAQSGLVIDNPDSVQADDSCNTDDCCNTSAVSSCGNVSTTDCGSPYYVNCVSNGCSGSGGYGCSLGDNSCIDGGCNNCSESCPEE